MAPVNVDRGPSARAAQQLPTDIPAYFPPSRARCLPWIAAPNRCKGLSPFPQFD
jgi:hypothetical protein